MALKWPAMLVIAAAAMMCFLASSAEAGIVPPYNFASMEGRKLGLVSNGFDLTYHGGPTFSGRTIPINIIWYGSFTPAQKSIVLDYFASFAPSRKQSKGLKSPSVATWWSVTGLYRDKNRLGVSKSVKVGAQVVDNLSLGKSLTIAQIESLVAKWTKKLGANPGAIYYVLTAANVLVDGFCGYSCASHATVTVSRRKLVYAWVGNSATQCPGMCAWPFAAPNFPGAPPFTPLKPPNNDVGVDGMIITISTVLAGSATNPQDNGWYQGDPGYPLEAATACQGSFGSGSYPGYPGVLLQDKYHRSYNAYGINRRIFLLPALWNPKTSLCKTLPH